MSKWIPNAFSVPNFIFSEGLISKFTHCELAVFLYCCNKKGQTANKFSVNDVASTLNFHNVSVFDALKLCCDMGLISFDYECGLDSIFDSFVYIESPVAKSEKPKKSSNKSGYIYALSNEGFNGFLKIGVTTRPIEKRLAELNKGASSLSLFKIEFSAYTSDAFIVEKEIHEALSHCRVRENKEFFEISKEEAKAVITNMIRV